MKKKIMWAMVLGTLASPALASSPATPLQMTSAGVNTWTQTYDAATYKSSGTVTFNDWGYTGPTALGGSTPVGVNDFKVGAGYNAANLGQMQKVITKAPDWQTSDALQNVTVDMSGVPYPNSNMDGQTQFYQWGYTTPANSTFSNMKIDRAGNYFVAREDMSFGLYNTFDQPNGAASTQVDTKINFKPYTVSDAAGWCGSVMTSNPNSLEQMAGQITFNIAFDVYFDWNPSLATTPKGDYFSSTELIPGMVMRSYGDYTVDITTELGELQHYTGSAVGNNTDPTKVVLGKGSNLDSDYQNQVSFLGAGVIPKEVWVSADSFNPDGSRKMRNDYNPTTGETDSVWDVTIVEAGTAGARKHVNAYGGYAFLMRADGTRELKLIGPDGHSAYMPTDAAAYTSIGQTAPVPVPAAVWLMGSGLLGLVGVARTRRKSV